MDEIELRPIGRKGLTSLRVVSAVLICSSVVHLLVLGLVALASMTGRAPVALSLALGSWCLAWAGVLAWGAGVAAEEIADYQPGWLFRR